MPLINPAQILVGPCLVQTRGQTFHSKGNVVLTPKLETFTVQHALVGDLSEREKDFSYEVSFTPVGALAGLAVLWPYGSALPGELLHATATLVSLSYEVLTTTTLARFRDGCPVRISSSGAMPNALDAGTTYFLHKTSVTTGTLHLTEAAALAATDPIDPLDAGTGRVRLIEEDYLTIHTFEGDIYTFHNSVVVQSPDMEFSAERTSIGEVKFEGFRRFGIASTNAASIYTKTTGGVTDTSFAEADIITESPTFTWGADAPWSAMVTKTGVSAKFPLTLDPVGDDASGTTTRRITALAATVSARPLNVLADDVHAALVPQGAGAGRGRSLSTAKDLDCWHSALWLNFPGAVLKPGVINHDTKEERVGELTWTAARIFSGGVAQPLYQVAASD